ncbi:uncharacterized protein TEOVI_000039800 [Trypanosoma equiperdum]|uniref:Uncharacterized protein n=2 Tax=Trypanozoon TaxID=39700 RepID=Q38FP1_TRYB2|nr:hypothetical protein, unlikely [Trypanosoma brucei brucei TREU927]EAN76379.1 hypothetical protein, unlikely [Trypanosoma brucei brucei TREU927]SCU67110.1 hypothetical protein, conserved [Trypanosoma equiperdum]
MSFGSQSTTAADNYIKERYLRKERFISSHTIGGSYHTVATPPQWETASSAQRHQFNTEVLRYSRKIQIKYPDSQHYLWFFNDGRE